MSLVAIACLLAGFVQIRRGLSAVGQLRDRLGDVHAGRVDRVHGAYPSEIAPLVADLNTMLDAHERNVARAQRKAGDLAHGLKTPLAILAHESERARAAGSAETAAVIAEEVERMRRQIDYHLAQARAAASSAGAGARTSVVESVAGLIRTLERLHAGRSIKFRTDAMAGVTVRVNREDLDEMIGNLLDNACKWTRTTVATTATVDADSGRVAITIDDDGPGLEPAKRELVLRRGVRADEASPGAGLGLAIVRDLADVYGGTISLDSSPLGGVRARLVLPAATRT
jgi:signal transduction histidine kinase